MNFVQKDLANYKYLLKSQFKLIIGYKNVVKKHNKNREIKKEIILKRIFMFQNIINQ